MKIVTEIGIGRAEHVRWLEDNWTPGIIEAIHRNQ
jgi:hypothetical protein